MVHLPDTIMDDRENMDNSTLWSLIIESVENGFYDNPSFQDDDIWKKFDLESLPTPPSSPIYEPYEREIDTVLNKTLSSTHHLDDEVLSQTFTVLPNKDLDTDTQLQNSLIKDCMWSAPGLIAAGFLPGDSVTGSSVCSNSSTSCNNTTHSPKQSKLLDSSSNTLVDENSNTICKKLNVDINTKDCVDPASVFPCPTSRSNSRNGSPDPVSSDSSLSFHGYDLGMDTPSASSDSDDEEIDVVTVAEKQLAMSRPARRPLSLALNKPSSPSSSSHNQTPHNHHQHLNNSRPLSTTLPAATSVSAQVAAMHNYSSTTSQPKLSSSRDYHKTHHSYSAPQTPSSGSHHHSSSGHKRLRQSYSSPSSPQYSKKQKLINGESDLKAVARKLSSRRTNHHSSRVNNTSSSNSSDMEDNSELGKRQYHNVLERKRRDDLRASFHQLRDTVPEICTNERAPKMVILNKAMDHIRGLNRTHKMLGSEKERQQQIYDQLKRKLAILRIN